MSDELAPARLADRPQDLLDRLAEGAVAALPDAVADGSLAIERDRSLMDRVAGRPGRVGALRLTHGTESLSLRLDGGRPVLAEAAVVSGGVVIARRTMPVGQWLGRFADQVAAVAADRIGDAAAAASALAALGLAPAGADVAVHDAAIEQGLGSLALRLQGRVPDAAREAVARIAELLCDTIPRLTGTGESEVTVRRTATVYLPDTLRAYLALPADWAATHRLPNGETPAAALLAQLGALETAVRRMRDAAVAADASALQVNGRFLADRFAVSSLDLP